MQRKLTIQEKCNFEPETKNEPRKKSTKKTIEVQCRWIRKRRPGLLAELMSNAREWHRHGFHKSVNDAEKAVAQLNAKDGFAVGERPKERVWEYRIKT